MNLLRLAWASVWNRRVMALLVVLTIALSSALLIGVDILRLEAKRSFERTVSGTDLIVGARTGAVPLLLYTVFHIGEPSNNMSYASYMEIAAKRNVAWTIPISLGDSHRGYRVIGTRSAFFEHYKFGSKRPLTFASGAAFTGLFDVVLGADVAAKLGYQIGSDVVLAHGTGKVSFAKHDKLPFKVVGILNRTGTPVDRSLMVSLEAITAIHIGWETGIGIGQVKPETLAQRDLTPTAITAFMLGLNNRIGTFGLQREINQFKAEPLMAVLPTATLQQLWQLVGVAENALLIVSAAVVFAGLLAMLIALWSSLEQRRREMAILRALGARASTVFGLLMLESAVMTLLGLVLGLVLLFACLALAGPTLASSYGLYLEDARLSIRSLQLLGLIFLASLLISALPAFVAYRKALSDALAIRF